jgi:hypothetical protein
MFSLLKKLDTWGEGIGFKILIVILTLVYNINKI